MRAGPIPAGGAACSARPSRPCAGPTTWRCSTSTGWSTSAATPSPARRTTWRRPRRRDAARLHHQQRLAARRPWWRRTCASWGSAAGSGDVVTSAQAAARVLRGPARCRGAGRAASVPPGCETALRDAGLEPVRGADADADAIATGYGPDVRVARHHAGRGADPGRAAVGRQQHRPDLPHGVRRGAGPRGPGRDAPALQPGSSRWSPGKPARPLLDETVRRVGGERPLMVGRPAGHRHRRGAQRRRGLAAGADRGDRAAELVAAAAEAAADLPRSRPRRAAASRTPAPEQDGTDLRLGGWRRGVEHGRLAVTGGGAAADWWRVVAAAAWDHLDRHRRAAASTTARAAP